eukprot:m.461047 g.461047  ORF g.461047 m.461047 type:complete len:424 (+) comp22194_c0_seq1:55-1326(+)
MDDVPSQEALEAMGYAEVRTLARTRGVKASGKKADIIARLLKVVEPCPQDEGAPADPAKWVMIDGGPDCPCHLSLCLRAGVEFSREIAYASIPQTLTIKERVDFFGFYGQRSAMPYVALRGGADSGTWIVGAEATALAATFDIVFHPDHHSRYYEYTLPDDLEIFTAYDHANYAPAWARSLLLVLPKSAASLAAAERAAGPVVATPRGPSAAALRFLMLRLSVYLDVTDLIQDLVNLQRLVKFWAMRVAWNETNPGLSRAVLNDAPNHGLKIPPVLDALWSVSYSWSANPASLLAPSHWNQVLGHHTFPDKQHWFYLGSFSEDHYDMRDYWVCLGDCVNNGVICVEWNEDTDQEEVGKWGYVDDFVDTVLAATEEAVRFRDKYPQLLEDEVWDLVERETQWDENNNIKKGVLTGLLRSSSKHL